MGSGDLPGRLICGLAFAAVLVIAGCGSGSKAGKTATRVASATEQPSPTATHTATPSPTPDPLAVRPSNATDAQAGVEAELIADPTNACPPRLTTSWGVKCAVGDADGDGKPDTAFLVPLQAAVPAQEKPAAVLVLRSSTKQIASLLEPGSTGDASVIGSAFFAYHPLPSGSGAFAFLTSGCSNTGCISQAHLERWDGTAWRDTGPGDAGVTALESAAWDASGELVLKGGQFTAPGAGPTRAVTVTYAYDGTRYAEKSRIYAAPVYLFHAITDADAKFAAADWAGAIAAYQAAISNPTLKDWKAEQGQAPGDPTLDAYALFRIAIATAAEGNDPSVALDKVIVDAKDPIFAYAAQQFRIGWQQTASVHGGCVTATAYLGTSNASGDNPAYITQAFNYGYANQPVKTYRDICPL